MKPQKRLAHQHTGTTQLCVRMYLHSYSALCVALVLASCTRVWALNLGCILGVPGVDCGIEVCAVVIIVFIAKVLLVGGI